MPRTPTKGNTMTTHLAPDGTAPHPDFRWLDRTDARQGGADMHSNMPVLWQNALFQFQDCPIAQKAWVWFAETRGSGMQYAADAYANEVKHLVSSLRPMLDAARSVHSVHGADDEVMDDLLRFILIRHANWRLGGNVIPAFLNGGS